MYTSSDVLAFIFARGGSKGLPNKNILEFAGQPLISTAINSALDSEYIDEIYVSTDSQQIAEVAEKNGAVVPFLRPLGISGDTSPEIAAWKHAINWFQETYRSTPKTLVSVPTTSPLRLTDDIDRCIRKFFESEGRYDAIITVTEANRNPFFNMVNINPDETVSLVNDSGNFFQRQSAPQVFDVCTVAYVANCDFIMETDNLFSGKLGAVKIPRERAIDIDTEFDFKVAEFFFKKRKEIDG